MLRKLIKALSVFAVGVALVVGISAGSTFAQGTNLITNGDFSSGTSGWSPSVTSPSAASFTVVSGQLYVDITSANTTNWHINLTKNGIGLQNGVNYTLSFDARAQSSRNIAIQVKDGSQNSITWQNRTLSTAMSNFSATFANTGTTSSNYQLLFFLDAAGVNDVWLDNITLTGPGGTTSYTLSTVTSPTAGGTIILSPAGGTYPNGTNITATATANSGYTFSGWSGALSGTSPTGVVLMNSNKSITASFSPNSQPPVTGLWSANGTNIYSSNTGNVGVGTTSPNQKLHVSGEGDVKTQVQGTNSAAMQAFHNGNGFEWQTLTDNGVTRFRLNQVGSSTMADIMSVPYNQNKIIMYGLDINGNLQIARDIFVAGTGNFNALYSNNLNATGDLNVARNINANNGTANLGSINARGAITGDYIIANQFIQTGGLQPQDITGQFKVNGQLGKEGQVLGIVNGLPKWRKPQLPGYLEDIDGNVYQTIRIGTQEWTLTNLKVTRLNDGTEIPEVRPNAEWKALTTPGYCWYGNDKNANGKYGALYNWGAVNSGKLAPPGWRVPTLEDWQILERYLEGNMYSWDNDFASLDHEVAKSLAASGWTTHPTPGRIGNDQATNNKSGFSAHPSGIRKYWDGTFTGQLSYAAWWSSSVQGAFPDGSPMLWNFSLSYENPDTFIGSTAQYSGFSVRLVKTNLLD